MNNSNIDSQAESIFSCEASVDKSPSSYGSVGWNNFGFTNSPLTTNFPFFEVIVISNDSRIVKDHFQHTLKIPDILRTSRNASVKKIRNVRLVEMKIPKKT